MYIYIILEIKIFYLESVVLCYITLYTLYIITLYNFAPPPTAQYWEDGLEGEGGPWGGGLIEEIFFSWK